MGNDVMSMRRRLMAARPSGGLLPAEYQQIEYIESTGTQYIDTNLVGDLTSGELYVKFMIINGSPSNTQFIGTGVDTEHELPKITFENNVVLRQKTNSSIAERTVGAIYDVRVDANGNVYVNNDQTAEINTITKISSSYKLFSVYPSAMQYAAKARLYGLSILDIGAPIAHLIPCYRKQDNKPGLYDAVRQLFLINSGSGEFSIPS